MSPLLSTRNIQKFWMGNHGCKGKKPRSGESWLFEYKMPWRAGVLEPKAK